MWVKINPESKRFGVFSYKGINVKFKNVSNRPHWVGDTLIAPGATVEVDAKWATAVQTEELQAVKDEAEVVKAKPGRKPKEAVDQTAPEAE